MRWLLLAASLLAATAHAAPPLEELQLQAEYPVEGMPNGNLSGLAMCGESLWALSDRDDDRLYQLSLNGNLLQAEAEVFNAPEPPQSNQPWGLRVRNQIASLVRGGIRDFEGLSCDAKGNRYLVSETESAVLQVASNGTAQWLNLPAALKRQARASGMLLHFNQGFEGIAIDPSGERLWLAAEQRRRGLVVAHQQNGAWSCAGGCVLLSEGGEEPSPAALGGHPAALDFAGLSFHDNSLFTLERQAYRICRRALPDGAVERCWSFAAEGLSAPRRYPVNYGTAEALWVDQDGAWIGIDDGNVTRADGEKRSIVWRFKAPKGGWSQRL